MRSVQGGVSSGVTMIVWVLRSPLAGRALDFEGHRFARVLEAVVGQPHRVEVIVAVDLDDPVARAETRRLGRRVRCGSR